MLNSCVIAVLIAVWVGVAPERVEPAGTPVRSDPPGAPDAPLESRDNSVEPDASVDPMEGDPAFSEPESSVSVGTQSWEDDAVSPVGRSAEEEFGDELDDEPWPDEVEDLSEVPVYDPQRDSPPALRARHWIRVGIVSLTTGGVLLVGAILMGVSDPCRLAIGNSCQIDARNRAALVMGIPAAIVGVGGSIALGMGLKERRSLRLGLQAGIDGVGLRVGGRF